MKDDEELIVAAAMLGINIYSALLLKVPINELDTIVKKPCSISPETFQVILKFAVETYKKEYKLYPYTQ